MKLNIKYLSTLFTLLFTVNLYSQEVNKKVNFDFGVFEYEYNTDANTQTKKGLIKVTLTMVNFGEILIFHRANENKKDFDLISTQSSNCKSKESKSNKDTLELIYSFIHFNLSDTTKVFSSVPHSDLITLKKHSDYYIYCNFKYIENDWVAKIKLNKGVIIKISVFKYDRDRRKVLNSIGTMRLVKKNIQK